MQCSAWQDHAGRATHWRGISSSLNELLVLCDVGVSLAGRLYFSQSLDHRKTGRPGRLTPVFTASSSAVSGMDLGPFPGYDWTEKGTEMFSLRCCLYVCLCRDAHHRSNSCEGLGTKTFEPVKQIIARGSWVRQNPMQGEPPGTGGGRVVSGAGRECAVSLPFPSFLWPSLGNLQSFPAQKSFLDPIAHSCSSR